MWAKASIFRIGAFSPRRRTSCCGRSARSAVESLRELDNQAFGSADVAEAERVLVVDDLADRLPAGVSDAGDDTTHVVDGEGDVPESGAGRGRRPLSSAGGGRLEADDLEDVAPVGAASHHDLDGHVVETDDPADPLAAEHAGLATVESEQREEPDRLVEVLDDEPDVDEAGDAGAVGFHVLLGSADALRVGQRGALAVAEGVGVDGLQLVELAGGELCAHAVVEAAASPSPPAVVCEAPWSPAADRARKARTAVTAANATAASTHPATMSATKCSPP